MDTTITSFGLKLSIQRLIQLLKLQPMSTKKSHEILLITTEGKKMSVYLEEFTNNNRTGYYVLLDFSQYITRADDADDDNEPIIEHDRDYETSMYKLLHTYPCFLWTRSLCVLCNIDENCNYFYYETNGAIEEIMYKLHMVLNAHMCECGQNMILDDGDVCFTCSMGLDEDDQDKHLCPICYEESYKKIIKMDCCNQFIHKSCLETNRIEFNNHKCPLCRSLTDNT